MYSRAVEEVSKPLQNQINRIRFPLAPDGLPAVYFKQGKDITAQGLELSSLTASENAQPQPHPARLSRLR